MKKKQTLVTLNRRIGDIIAAYGQQMGMAEDDMIAYLLRRAADDILRIGVLSNEYRETEK